MTSFEELLARLQGKPSSEKVPEAFAKPAVRELVIKELTQVARAKYEKPSAESVSETWQRPEELTPGELSHRASLAGLKGQLRKYTRGQYEAKKTPYRDKLRDCQTRIIYDALAQTAGNISAAADSLNISRERLYQILAQQE
jgi:DNA-binding NtrC family response regulator